MSNDRSLRFGLCCTFRDEPIAFRNTTVKAVRGMDGTAARAKLARLCLGNAEALQASLAYCLKHGIGCFRINSQILPLKTHAECGYDVDQLPDGEAIVQRFQACGDFARQHGLRTCFHPDQFVVLNSPRPEVVAQSLAELEYQAEVAQWVGADVINLHAGGAYGDKRAALDRFAATLDQLSHEARSRLTVENDDVTYTPEDLLPLCQATGVPLVYDVHHHRCHGDRLSIEEATERAIATWDREPMFHLSSPLEGWTGPRPRRHHDLIDVADFPDCWRGRRLTVEVEAKAKEVAVRKLMRQLEQRWVVYLLRCGDGTLYTGVTCDLERRVAQHQAGTASRYTRGRLPVTLAYQEPASGQGAALQRERAIKAMSRTAKETLIGGTSPS